MTVKLVGETGVTVEEISFDSLILLDDMQPAGENLWQYDFGSTHWDPVMYCAIGDRHLQGVRSMDPSAQNEWDTTDNGLLTVYSAHKPLVYAARASMPIVFLKDCKNIIVRVQAMYAALGVRMYNCDNVDVQVEADYVGRGALIDKSSDVVVTGSRIENAAQAGIQFYRACPRGHVFGNRLHRCGQSESSASIYAGNTQGPVTVYDNKISDQTFGRYWQWDGGGVYCDHHTTEFEGRNNTIMNGVFGLQDNSGSSSNRLHHNLIVDCDRAYKSVDVSNVGNGRAVVEDNILVNTPDEEDGTNLLLVT